MSSAVVTKPSYEDRKNRSVFSNLSDLCERIETLHRSIAINKEFSWLDHRGKPQVAQLNITVPADSPNVIESKSMKLYLNGFSQTQFVSEVALQKVLSKDLNAGFGADIALALQCVDQATDGTELAGLYLDQLDVDVDVYDYQPDFLTCSDNRPPDVQRFYSHVFRSLCPVTSQPDWASLVIECEGQAIDPVGGLR